MICINTLGLENRQKDQPVIVFQIGMGTTMGKSENKEKGN